MSGLAVHSRGDGPTLVLLHGWGLNSSVWDHVLPHLDGLRTLAVDLPGHGRSRMHAAGLVNWAQAVAEAVDGEAVFLGWSLGGLVCQQLALLHPAKVRGLVLVASTPRFLAARDWPHGMKATTLDAFGSSLAGDYVATLQEFLVLQMLGQPEARTLLRQLRYSLQECPPTLDGLQRGLEILRDTDLRARIPELRCPALVIAGGRDRLAHPETARWLAAQLPAAESWELPHTAHVPFLANEAGFAARVKTFVEDCHAGTARRRT